MPSSAFRGSVKNYRDQLQLSIDDCREATEGDRNYGFEESKLIPSTREDIDDLWRRLERLVTERVERPVLRRLAAETLAVHGQALRDDPHLRHGLNVHRGRITNRAVAESLGLSFFPPEEAIAA